MDSIKAGLNQKVSKSGD